MAYVHFPNPNLRKGQLKRRFFTPRLLDRLHFALDQAGRISFMTDDRELYTQVIAMVQEDGRYQVVPATDYRLVLDLGLISSHQRIWEARGRETLRLELQKRPPEDGNSWMVSYLVV